MEASAVSSTRDVPEATPADTGGTSGSGAAGESAAEGGAALPTDAELRDAVRRYITQHAAQLEALTRKDVMKFLASTFGTDVTCAWRPIAAAAPVSPHTPAAAMPPCTPTRRL